MSRYSSSGLSSYSSYRSPYLDSPASSYSTTNYSLPAYESKFESLISRVDGKARSRAGTSTKYDYLNSYSSKYDYPSTSSYTSSYTSPTYPSTSSNYPSSSSSTYTSPYSAHSSALNADDLTKSYFEKYYKTSPAADSPSRVDDKSYSRASRALSVYLDDTSSGYSSTDTKQRTFRSTSIAGEDTTSRASSRLTRLYSTNDDEDSYSTLGARRSSLAPRTSRFLDREKDDDTTLSKSNGYSRYLDRDKEESKVEAEISTARTNGYTRYADREKVEDKEANSSSSSYSRSNGYSRFVDRDKEEDTAANSSTSSRRYSTYGGEETSSTPSYRREYTRTFGGRTDKDTTDTSYRSHAVQNGEDKEDSTSSTASTGGTGGLKNLGNTCFMNSVIQCLSNTKLLVDYLLTDEHTRDINTTNSSMKGSLIKAFSTVIKGLWKPGGRTVDPASLKGAVQRFAPRFSGYNQEDSQEFLRYLLEGLHEDVNRVQTKPQPINTEIDSNLSVHEQGMEAWKRYLRRDDSKLVDIFVGQLKSTLRCSTCDFESVTFEPFWDLSLPIPSRSGEISLNECLESFTKEEVMDGDEMPTCERCKARRRCIKFYSLYKLPKVLVIHLKRFSPTERFRSKLSNSVTFPLTSFDVSKFSVNPGRSVYSCYAVSNHSGTLYSGHYTAYARNPKTCDWHYFNDSRVSKSSSCTVISNEAYLLFFELLP